eukprot:366539-Chlamydomonas_euryale.AAC.2
MSVVPHRVDARVNRRMSCKLSVHHAGHMSAHTSTNPHIHTSTRPRQPAHPCPWKGICRHASPSAGRIHTNTNA